MRHLIVTIGLALALAVSPAYVGIHADGAPQGSAPQATEPDRPNRLWLRVKSNNFVAVGDASEAALRDAVTELEVFRSAMFSLSSVLPTPRFNMTTPVMVLFRNDSVFSTYKPRNSDGSRRNNVAGYYMRAPWGAYMLTSADGHRLGFQLSTVLHEYGHDVFHHTLGNQLPSWLDEGLAELCGSVGAAGESHVTGRYLGRPLNWHVAAVRGAERPTVAELLVVDDTAMRAMSENTIRLFYAKSWALVHYLMLGREDRRPGDVPAFVDALKAGRTPAEAFQQAFRTDMATIDTTLARYMDRVAFPAIRVEDTTAMLRTTTVEPMLESEVNQLQGHLLLQLNQMQDAQTRLSRALALNPDSVATRVSLADYQLTDGHPLEAIEVLAPVVTTEPRDVVALITLGKAQQRAGRHRDALDTFNTATTLKATEVAQAEAWYGRSVAAMSLDMPDEGAAAMTRAQSLSEAPGWYSRRARELWVAGRNAAALADAEMMQTLNNAGIEDRSYASFVGALAAMRIDRREAAAALVARSASPYDTPWTKTVRAYLLGDLSDREFLGKADGRGEQTEAHAYIGFVASLSGRLAEARQHLTWVRDRGSRMYTEYAMALAELARIGE